VIQGSWGCAPKGHTHIMRVVSWTTEEELRVLTACTRCGKTESIKASRRVKNIPAGFNVSSWEEFNTKSEARLESLTVA